MISGRRLELQRLLAEQVGWVDIHQSGRVLTGIHKDYMGPTGIVPRRTIPKYVLDPWDMVMEYGMYFDRPQHKMFRGEMSSTSSSGVVAKQYRASCGEIYRSAWHSDPRDAVFELYCRLKGIDDPKP